MVDEAMTAECVECSKSDETEYVVTEITGGAVGVYCWRCETLHVVESVVHGTVVLSNDL